MATSFPSALDTFGARKVIDVEDAVEALEAKVGVDGSTVTGSLDFRTRWMPADFMLFKQGSTYYARNGSTGLIQFSGAEPGAVMQSCITDLGIRGGTIVLGGRDDFAWGSIPVIPIGITGRLTIRALGRVKIILSNAAPRFVDFPHSPAAGSTFQNVTLDGIVLDASANTALGSSHHLLIGTSNGTNGAPVRANIQNITVRNCRVEGAKVDTYASGTQIPVFLSASHSAAAQAQNFIRNILIEDCVFDGGLTGIEIMGTEVPSFVGDADIWIDNITINRVRHTLRTAPANFQYSSHVHIGGASGRVGTVRIDDFWGYGTRDVGIEIDNFQDATIDNVTFEEYFGVGCLFANFLPPVRIAEQKAVVRNITGRHLAAANSSTSVDSCHLVAYTIVNSNPVGTIEVRGARYYSTRPDPVVNQMVGAGFKGIGQCTAVLLDDFEVIFEGINHTNTTTAVDTSHFWFEPSGTPVPRIRLRNVRVVFRGTAAVGASANTIWPVEFRGTCVFDIDGLAAEVNVTDNSTFAVRLLNIGTASGSNLRGTIRGLRVVDVMDKNPVGVRIGGSSTLTIPGEILIDDADFSAAPPTMTEVGVLAGNEAKVMCQNVRWRLFPKVVGGITVGASPFAYRNTSNQRETVNVRGGTVSAIAYSRDNSTWTTLADATGLTVQVDPGEYLRVTYTAAPTMVSIPHK